MKKIFSSILQTLKKWSLLRVSIIVLGNLVIFGLGFALGLNYAQNLYLVKKRVLPNRTLNNEYNDNTADEFSFFYGLKDSDINVFGKGNYSNGIKKKIKNTENKKLIDDKNIKYQKNLLKPEKYEYTIQLYSFKSRDVSEKKILELKKRGYSAYQSKIDFGDNDIYYRVRVGQFKNREDASKVLEKLFVFETKEAYITRN